MKVKEIIKLLQKEDPELEVITDDYEGGYSFLQRPYKVKVVFNYRTNDPHMGDHEIVHEKYKQKFANLSQHDAVYIGRGEIVEGERYV